LGRAFLVHGGNDGGSVGYEREHILSEPERKKVCGVDTKREKQAGGEVLPRMNSNHDKVIQSHLVHDSCAIVATFSAFRAASLPVCPTGPSSSQLIEAKQLNFV